MKQSFNFKSMLIPAFFFNIILSIAVVISFGSPSTEENGIFQISLDIPSSELKDQPSLVQSNLALGKDSPHARTNKAATESDYAYQLGPDPCFLCLDHNQPGPLDAFKMYLNENFSLFFEDTPASENKRVKVAGAEATDTPGKNLDALFVEPHTAIVSPKIHLPTPEIEPHISPDVMSLSQINPRTHQALGIIETSPESCQNLMNSQMGTEQKNTRADLPTPILQSSNIPHRELYMNHQSWMDKHRNNFEEEELAQKMGFCVDSRLESAEEDILGRIRSSSLDHESTSSKNQLKINCNPKKRKYQEIQKPIEMNINLMIQNLQRGCRKTITANDQLVNIRNMLSDLDRRREILVATQGVSPYTSNLIEKALKRAEELPEKEKERKQKFLFVMQHHLNSNPSPRIFNIQESMIEVFFSKGSNRPPGLRREADGLSTRFDIKKAFDKLSKVVWNKSYQSFIYPWRYLSENSIVDRFFEAIPRLFPQNFTKNKDNRSITFITNLLELRFEFLAYTKAINTVFISDLEERKSILDQQQIALNFFDGFWLNFEPNSVDDESQKISNQILDFLTLRGFERGQSSTHMILLWRFISLWLYVCRRSLFDQVSDSYKLDAVFKLFINRLIAYTSDEICEAVESV